MKKYYVYIDESGDPGNIQKQGSTKYFVMVAIIFDDVLEMETVSTNIKKLSRKLFRNDYHEFHFANERNSDRQKFFETVKPNSFKIYSVTLDKSKQYPANIYELALINLLNELQSLKGSLSIKFDGQASKSYKFAVQKVLKFEASKYNFKIGKVTYLNSKNDSLIQLADMCVGLIRKVNENKEKMFIEMLNDFKKTN